MSRRTLTRAVGGLLAAGAIVALGAPESLAHVAIRVEIEAPEQGDRFVRDGEAAIRAFEMFAGIESTKFTAFLDGSPIDATSGARILAPQPRVIRAGETLRIPLRNLPDGRHTLTVRYEPDVDAAPLEESVEFHVGEAPSVWPIVGAGLGAGAILAAIVFRKALRERRRRAASTAG